MSIPSTTSSTKHAPQRPSNRTARERPRRDKALTRRLALAILSRSRLARGALSVTELATAAKSFEDNLLIGSRALNAWGLHSARVILAQKVAAQRRASLATLVRPEDRASYERDGVVVRRNFLPADVFARMMEKLRAFSGRAREKWEGRTLMRKFAVDADFRARVPECVALLESREFLHLLSYVGAQSAAPMIDVQALFREVDGGDIDPQTLLHADTFHPNAKAWLFLTDVAEDAGAFSYVFGSHRLNKQRLLFERANSLRARNSPIRDVREGSFRIDPEQLSSLGLPPPTQLAVPANTLVVADTFGFHARGPALRSCTRVEFRVLGRRSPFLPFKLEQSIRSLHRVSAEEQGESWRDDVALFAR